MAKMAWVGAFIEATRYLEHAALFNDFENNYHADVTNGKSLELQLMKSDQEHIELLNVNCLLQKLFFLRADGLTFYWICGAISAFLATALISASSGWPATMFSVDSVDSF
ncbi:hypothetical protein EDB19DRAFT_1905549 [Suillus lakei]|nr:hypothetical protein EDB19DRAFT_1905549 [Suillus lakei]